MKKRQDPELFLKQYKLAFVWCLLSEHCTNIHNIKSSASLGVSILQIRENEEYKKLWSKLLAVPL